jgi:hypothetical protein
LRSILQIGALGSSCQLRAAPGVIGGAAFLCMNDS